MRTNSHRHGKHEMRTQEQADGGWIGVANQGGKRVAGPLRAPDEMQVLAALRSQINVEHPDFHGMDEAVARFLRIYPGGFAGADYRHAQAERVYKDKAVEALKTALPLAAAANATPDQAAALVTTPRLWIALPHTTETARLRDTLRSDAGARFVQAAAALTRADLTDNLAINTALAQMTAAVKPHGTMTWPIATYLPFLWCSDVVMFIKPEAQIAFASRVGDPFQHEYSPEMTASTWRAGIALAARTRTALDAAGLAPTDNVDVQSFIWVVAKYSKDREIA